MQNNQIIYGYDGNIPLTVSTWKCATCDRFFSIDYPCVSSNETQYPNTHLEPNDNCKYYNKKEYIVKENLDDNILEVQTFNKTTNKYYKGSVNMNFGWNDDVKDVAINKAIDAIEMEIYKSSQECTNIQPDIMEENVIESNTVDKTNEQLEDTLKGDISINWFDRVTSWKRVLNAARRTIGKPSTDKEPSNSWKAKILLAEHSPIRLLEYDWGWSKIDNV